MPAITVVWTQAAKRQFKELLQRAMDANQLDQFVARHKEIAAIVCDLERAIAKSDPLYSTKKPGGVVRHLLYKSVSVTFSVFAAERVGWIMKYLAVPTPSRGPDKHGD